MQKSKNDSVEELDSEELESDKVSKEDLEDKFLLCRTLGHSWKPFSQKGMTTVDYGWRFSVRCSSCRTKRHQIIHYGTGIVSKIEYIYPKGYRLTEKASRVEMRLEYAKRNRYDFIAANQEKRAEERRLNATA